MLLLLLVAGVVWVQIPVPALSAWFQVPPRPPAQGGLPWLSTANGHIVDSGGRVVLLRGMNDDALAPQPGAAVPFTARDAVLMHQLGFDVVRVPLSWAAIEPRPGQFSAAYLDRIARVVSLCNRNGLYVVFDMHFMMWSSAYRGIGAPAWATVPLVPNITWGGGTPSLRSQLSPAVDASEMAFWYNSSWQRNFDQAWAFVARRFRDDSGVAGYDLFNEPHFFPYPPVRFAKDLMWPFYQRTIAALAPVDPYHLFIVEADLVGNFPTTVVPLHAPDLVYSAHIYTESLAPSLNGGGPQAIRTHIAEMAREATAVPAAFWVGEFGIAADASGAGAWIDTNLDMYDRIDAGWAWWQWRQNGPWGIRNAAGTTVHWSILHHLARPYLLASPASLAQRWSETADRSLTISLAARSAPDSLAVGWPSVLLGAPQVSGTCPVTGASSPGRQQLTVAPGPACTLVVTPRS